LLDKLDSTTLALHSTFVRAAFAIKSTRGFQKILSASKFMPGKTSFLKSCPAVDLDLTISLCQWTTLLEGLKWLGALQRLSCAGFHFLLSASPTLFPVADEAGLTVDSAANSAAFFATVEGLFCQLRKTHVFAHLIGGLGFFILNWFFHRFLVRR
jgi:hypothetical protein